jgi:signal peptidase I
MEPFTPPSGPLTWIETLARLPIATVVLAMAVCTVIRLAIAPMQNRLARFVNNLLDAIIYAGILVYLIIRPYIAQPFYIPSESMVPTLRVGDVVMVGKYNYRFSKPKRFDIVVFRAPDWALNPWQTPGKTDFVKRLIGLARRHYRGQGGRRAVPQRQVAARAVPEQKLLQYSMKVINGWVYTLEYGRFR